MASYVTPKRATAFKMFVGLPSQANPSIFQSNPTIAAGDFKVSKDGGALANLTALPSVSPASSKMVMIDLDATEMTADNITVICSDAAGAEWGDVVINIQTSARQVDDLAYPTTSGRSMDVDASGGVEVGSFQAGAIGAAAFAAGAIDNAAIAADAIGASEIAADAIGSSELAATAAAEIADAVWDEAVSGHTTQGTYGERQNAVISGNAIAGTLSTTQMTTDLTEATDDHFNGRTLIWTSGVLLGQATAITDYTGASKLLTYTAVTEAPSAGDDFLIV